ncbi:Uncharacterized conserved small protein [Mycobacteroides abscessus subsp. bolletii]|uniref:XRE family transcriptional regulator n=1 Tax=Mycobacteroides abscessus TaxID=36809 RepID=UPI0009A710F1|nr:XRE family transcriptional regulator [Mycobacteroides abscessus]SKU75281.1 Uncharacterized conserved small protein [Mycobacteroides abscessus subsp. bolletii]
MIYDSVWDAICDNKEEAADLRQRASHLYQLQQTINTNGWTDVETANALSVTLERSRALIDGRINEFTLKELGSLSKAISA